MRSVTRAHSFILASMLALPLLLAFSLVAQASDGGYRLLELDGYKVKWGDRRLGVGASISYAFAREPLMFEEARNCSELAPIEMLLGDTLSKETLARETQAAFQVWERVAGLSFYEVDDAQEADIILGAQGRPRGRAFANVSYAPDPQDGVRAIDRALVCMNPDLKWKVGFDGNKDVYDLRYTLIHEIGHAIGLDHPGPSGQVMGFRYTEAFAELQPGDLRGVRLLYGRSAGTDELGKGFDSQLAQKPTEVLDANNLLGHSVTSATEDE